MTNLIAIIALISVAQEGPALPQFVAELRQSLAQNQAKLRKLTWTETREISLKGEVKKREQFDCSYDTSGKLQRNPIGAPSEPKNAPRGLKGRMVANKVDELKDYMARVGSLVRRYVPPDPQALKTALEGGKASFVRPPEGGTASVIFRDYAKPGDQVTVVVDMKSKKLRSFRVSTYLDSPGDTVKIDAAFSLLSNGVSYLEQSVLDASAKEIQITTTNFGHH